MVLLGDVAAKIQGKRAAEQAEPALCCQRFRLLDPHRRCAHTPPLTPSSSKICTACTKHVIVFDGLRAQPQA